MPAYNVYLDTTDRNQLLVWLAVRHAHCLFDCPLKGKFPDRTFFEILRDNYLEEFLLENHDTNDLKRILGQIDNQSVARMARSTPATRRTAEHTLNDLWSQIRHVYNLLVSVTRIQALEKDLFMAIKVCSSGIEPESLLRTDAEPLSLIEITKNRLLAIARDKSRGYLPWLRNLHREVSIQMENRRSDTMSCTPMTESDDGDGLYDDERDGDLSDDDRTTYRDSEDCDTTSSPCGPATPFSSSPYAQYRIFSSSPFPSSATDAILDDDDGHCEDSITTSRSPTPSPAEYAESIHGLPRLRPIGPSRSVPVGSNTANIGLTGNLASVEAPVSRRNSVIYVDLTEGDDAPGHPVGEELQGPVSARNQETPRIPKKKTTPVLNGVFGVAFPNGVRTLEVARDGYCGFYAIIESYKAQYPHHPPPTVEALQDALMSRAMDGIFETLKASKLTGDELPEVDFDCNNTRWFLQDHLAAIFSLWVHQELGLKAVLGIRTNEIPHLHEIDDTDKETFAVWIGHNGLDHYYGLAASESPCQNEDGESAKVPTLDSSTRSQTPRRSFASSGHNVSPDPSYELLGREEASHCAKELTLPPPGSRLVDLRAEANLVLEESMSMGSTPVRLDNFSFDAFCRDDRSSERLEVFDTHHQLEDDCNMSDESGTMRQNSRSTSPECFQQYASLEGCEKIKSSDLMMPGASQPDPVEGEVRPSTQRQLPTPQPTHPSIQAQIELPTPTQAPPKRKNNDTAAHRSGGPGMLISFTLARRPKDAETASHPPPKRQKQDLASRSSPGAHYPMYPHCQCQSRKKSHLARRCISEQPQPTW